MSYAMMTSTLSRFAELSNSLDRPPSRMQALGNEMGAPGPAWPASGERDWLAAARAALRRNGDRAGIGVVFRSVDHLLKERRFRSIDEVLSTTDPASLPRALQLAILTITFVPRARLAARPLFFEAVHRVLRQRGEDADLILRGLR